MVKIQIDLNEEENQMVEIYKATIKAITKEEAVKSMINHIGKPLLETLNKKKIPLAYGTLKK